MVIDKKRKRSEGQGKRSKAPNAGSKRQKSNAGKRVTSVDSLAWKTVEVPEMYDDAEGFYGLEEVEGVDIVRDGDTVKFVAAVTAESDASEEFGGFDDAPEGADGAIGEGSAESTEQTAPVTPNKESKKKKKGSKGEENAAPKPDAKDQTKEKKGKKEKKGAKVEQAKEDTELEANVFAQAADLAEAEAEDNDIDMSQWVPLDLSPQILSSIARLKFAKPTAIQARAIPQIMNGHDVVGKAATGSGKTLAFGIPIVESWLAKRTENPTAEKKGPIAMILSPTRELAHQICDHLKLLCAGLTTGPYICSVTGGLAVQKQQRQLERADIVVGTPGRMWELMSSSNSVLGSLRGIDFLVVDEADRLLKDGHFKDAEEILKAIDRTAPGEEVDDDSEDEAPRHHRQTLVFSATFNKNLQQKLAGKARFNLTSDTESLEYLLKKLNFREERPKFVDTNPISQMAENLKEGLIQCGDLEKDLYLYSAANNTTQTPSSSSSTSSTTSSSILIATDVAARGLDIPNIDLVIHYHVPRTADDYVHRSGRTARASTSGISILLCGPKEAVPTQRLIAKVHAAAAVNSSRAQLASAGVGVHTIDIDRRLVSHLRPRVGLAKKITETGIAKEKGAKEDDWMRNAAEELGVEFNAEELEAAGLWKGKGSGKKLREKEARAVTKAEVKQWRWELKELLARRVNTGVSEKYLGGATPLVADDNHAQQPRRELFPPPSLSSVPLPSLSLAPVPVPMSIPISVFMLMPLLMLRLREREYARGGSVEPGCCHNSLVVGWSLFGEWLWCSWRSALELGGRQSPGQKGQGGCGGGGGWFITVVVVELRLWERNHLVAVVRVRRPVRFPSGLGVVVSEVELVVVLVVSEPGDGGCASPVVASSRASSASWPIARRDGSAQCSLTKARITSSASQMEARVAWFASQIESSSESVGSDFLLEDDLKVVLLADEAIEPRDAALDDRERENRLRPGVDSDIDSEGEFRILPIVLASVSSWGLLIVMRQTEC
ncbi:P-loop containing nucleoside triphosphate hydrolase protein [Chaetomium tenue]|uniref:P-loop containing nucleoside triphosphate hydrolase protein n=1 Tax=Chaetomium tenue TaxID=1854479 RepID=A0ACB7PJR9_9PEZI|nr:P-loop containing nucleoside triphosphate hydrolase protein [Chaetomium globosum]